LHSLLYPMYAQRYGMSTASWTVSRRPVVPVNLPIDIPLDRQARSPEGQGSDAEEIEEIKAL
jgi:hypothetical protein